MMQTRRTPSRVTSAAHRVVELARRRPVLSVFVVAFATRMAFGVGTILVTDGAVIPDEYQYLDIAEWASEDRLGPEVWQGYGQSMFGSVDGFMWPLTILFKIFWPWRLFGQLLAAAAGGATAAVTARLGLELGGRRMALLGGLFVALVPSQILWSGVVLRESSVWIGIAVPGLLLLAATRERSPWRLLLIAVGAGGCLYYLGNLRDQTAIAVGWSMAGAAVVVRARRRVLVPAGAAAVAVLGLWAAALGPGGAEFVRDRGSSLATTRAQLAVNADSAFVPRVAAPTTLAPRSGDHEPTAGDDDIDGGVAGPTRPGGGGGEVDDGEGGQAGEDGEGDSGLRPGSTNAPTPTTVVDSSGGQYVVDESAGADLRAIPRGLVATMLRPFPWESTDSLPLLFARLENLGWYALYGLAVLGAWFSRRRREVVAYPIAVTMAIAVIAALTQGNLGTAFRHRGQLVWAIALLAAAGALGLLDRWRARGVAEPVDLVSADEDVESPALIG